MEDASLEPTIMSLDLLRDITNGFSEERELGRGSFGKVYLGVYPDGGKIAVKLLYDMQGLDDEQFLNEFKNLTRLRHQNIVRLVGYCRDIQEVYVMYEGKLVIAEKAHRALCLEYMSNGSLDKFLSDECDRYDWYTSYGIIKGICQGLQYLHNELKPPIYHLDLKPANVLLDENMVPRIADFGMSRLFRDEQTRATKSTLGTIGYLPPEYICNNLVSNKFDIFSLGVVIIKIMAGRAGYFNSAEMCSQEFTNLVQEKWMNRLTEASNLRNTCSEQVKICIEIGLSCVQENRHKRPTIQDIVDRLNQTETKCTDADSSGDVTQQGYISNSNHQQTTPSISKPSSSYNMEANRNTFPQDTQDPNDRHVEKIYHGPTFNQNIVATTHSNRFEEHAGPTEARLDGDSQNDNQEYSADGDSLPGIEGFQIVGDPRLGCTLTACGFPINGTTLCHFQWVRGLEDGTMQSIEGATMYEFLVTADDVGALLAVDCTPMDDIGRQGDLVRKFANSENKITCDPEMQNDINISVSIGRADFDVYVLKAHNPDEWEQGTLVLRPAEYQINLDDKVIIHEKYSPRLQIQIPNVLKSTQFVLVDSGGLIRPFNTHGVTQPSSKDNDLRLRDLIVLVMRAFQKKALDAPVETKLNATRKSGTAYPLSNSSDQKLSIATLSPSTTNPTAKPAELLTGQSPLIFQNAGNSSTVEQNKALLNLEISEKAPGQESAGENQKETSLEDPMDTVASKEKVDLSGTDQGASNSDSSASFGTKMKMIMDGKTAKQNTGLDVLSEIDEGTNRYSSRLASKGDSDGQGQEYCSGEE